MAIDSSRLDELNTLSANVQGVQIDALDDQTTRVASCPANVPPTESDKIGSVNPTT